MSEIAELSKADIEPVCFDCCDLGADKVPSYFIDTEEVYYVRIERTVFGVSWSYLPGDEPYRLRFFPLVKLNKFLQESASVASLAPLSS
jgi:hypothetical protein